MRSHVDQNSDVGLQVKSASHVTAPSFLSYNFTALYMMPHQILIETLESVMLAMPESGTKVSSLYQKQSHSFYQLVCLTSSLTSKSYYHIQSNHSLTRHLGAAGENE